MGLAQLVQHCASDGELFEGVWVEEAHYRADGVGGHVLEELEIDRDDVFRLLLDLDLLYRQFNLLPDLLIVPVNQGIDVLFRPFGVFDQVLDHTRRAS